MERYCVLPFKQPYHALPPPGGFQPSSDEFFLGVSFNIGGVPYLPPATMAATYQDSLVYDFPLAVRLSSHLLDTMMDSQQAILSRPSAGRIRCGENNCPQWMGTGQRCCYLPGPQLVVGKLGYCRNVAGHCCKEMEGDCDEDEDCEEGFVDSSDAPAGCRSSPTAASQGVLVCLVMSPIAHLSSFAKRQKGTASARIACAWKG